MTIVNKNYGRAIDSNAILYAPRKFKENNTVIVPRIDDDSAYLLRNWFKVVERIPEYDPEKCALKQIGWEEDASSKEVFMSYEVVEKQPTPSYVQVRRFSKLRLVEFCMEQNVWNSLKAFLERLGYYDLVVMALMFLENDKFFKAGLAAYRDKRIEDGADPIEIDTLISQALDFAFDGYETVKDTDNSIKEQV